MIDTLLNTIFLTVIIRWLKAVQIILLTEIVKWCMSITESNESHESSDLLVGLKNHVNEYAYI